MQLVKSPHTHTPPLNCFLLPFLRLKLEHASQEAPSARSSFPVVLNVPFFSLSPFKVMFLFLKRNSHSFPNS